MLEDSPCRRDSLVRTQQRDPGLLRDVAGLHLGLRSRAADTCELLTAAVGVLRRGVQLQATMASPAASQVMEDPQ